MNKALADPTKRRETIETYLETIRDLSKSTDDYLYLMDLDTHRAYFTNDIHLKYNVPPCGDEGIQVDEWSRTIYPRDSLAVAEDLQKILSGAKTTHNMEYRLIDHNGNRTWISCRGEVFCDAAGKPLFMLGRVSDTVLGSKTDSLTGLLNGRKYVEDIQTAIAQKADGCLLVLGLDNFKDINIKYGRMFGNHLLKTVAQTLEKIISPVHLLYRLDGDHFGVNLISNSKETVEQVYTAIQKDVPAYCTLSAGAVLYHSEMAADGETLFQYAETALDRAKRQGKNMLVFFSPDDYEERKSTVELLTEMRASIQDNFHGFFLCYQPQVCTDTCRLFGAEALLRYESPTRGLVGPTEFIPLLEQSELICQVGRWVLRTALAMCLKWRQTIPDLHMSVNISYIQLRQKNIAQMVLDDLHASGLPGSALTLEVTESMQLEDYEYFNQIFFQWEQEGISIAIDDFGTGYSSLGYLKSMEIDEVKIDRCFVRGIQNSAYSYQLLNNTIDLARTTRIRVCCEGVETEDELLVLKELMPDTLQGYLFAVPYPQNDFEELYINSGSAEFRKRLEKESHYRVLTETEGTGSSSAETVPELEYPLMRELLDPMNQTYILDLMRKSDFYEAMLSETIAYAEIDIETGQPLTTGGLWLSYEDECRQWSRPLFDVIVSHIAETVSPEDAKQCLQYFNENSLQKLFQAGSSTQKHCFRRFVDGEPRWVELVIHLFQEHFTKSTYALLYLKDIDVEKKKEIAQVSAANTDPLTGVYNRRVFESEVTRFLERKHGTHSGALLMLDIDDFKSINDRYGHLEGDSALLRVTEVLQSTFRQRDIVGRLGGDEFLAFIKDVTSREILDRRVEELRQTLRRTKGIPLTCSVGITFIRGEDSNYAEYLKQADQALYQSKKCGKDCAFYFEDMN